MNEAQRHDGEPDTLLGLAPPALTPARIQSLTVEGMLGPVVPLHLTSVVAVLDDLSVVSLEDSKADPGLAAALTSVGLTLLRHIGASPRGKGPRLVLVDSFSHQDKHDAELFIATGGWIDEHRLVTTAVSRSVVLRGGCSNKSAETEATTEAHSRLRALAHIFLAGRVPEHVLDGAGGDPTLLGALVRQVRSRAWGLPGDLSVPATPAPYGALVTEQLKRLSPRSRSLTQALAVHGGDVPITQLGRLLPAEQSVTEELAPAIEAKLVRWADAGTSVSLAQEITRGAVLESMDAARRSQLRHWAAQCTVGVTSLLHRAAAADRPDPVTAHALERAARESQHAGQTTRAAQLFRLAADLSPDGRNRERRILMGMELALRSAFPPEHHVLRSALRGAIGPRADLLRARLAFLEGRLDASKDQMIRVLKDVQATEADDHRSLAVCAGWLAEVAWALDDPDALRRAGDAVDGCTEPGHRCLDTARLLDVLRAVAEQGVRAGLDTLSFLPADPAQVPPELAACLQVRGWLRLESCEPTAAIADTLAALHLSTQPRAQVFAPELAVTVMAQAYCLGGEWDDAEACAQLAHAITSPVWRELCRSVHQLVLAPRGLPRVAGLPAAQPYSPSGIPPVTRVVSAHSRVVGSWAQGSGRSTRTLAADLRVAEEYLLSHSMLWRLFDIIRTHCTEGSVSRAKRLLAGMEQWPDERPTAWAHVLRTWAQALVAAADGRHTDAVRAFADAEAAAEKADDFNAWHRALISRDHARLLAQAGEWSKSVALLRRAQAAFEHLEAWPIAEECGRELVRAQFMGSEERLAQWPGSRLTKRELEVASLVARGLTNNEIAQSLFLSNSGVAYHLSNIYTKLALRNRYELRNLWESVMAGHRTL